MVILVMTLNHFCSFSLHVNASTAHRYWMFTFATNISKRFLQLFPHTTHFAHLSSISWSFLWAASTSMQEPSVSGRERERLEGCGKVIGCGKVKLWVAVQGCGGAGLACCEDRGGQLLAGGHSWGVLVFEFSEMSTSASSINLLLLALHPLIKKEEVYNTRIWLFHALTHVRCSFILTHHQLSSCASWGIEPPSCCWTETDVL